MKLWKIITNFVHDPIEVRNSKAETMVDLRNVKWTKQMHVTVNKLVDEHNKEVKEAKKRK